MQLVINDNVENKFVKVWLDLFNQTLLDIQDYYTLAYESYELGKIIYDNQLADIAKVISRDLFIATYWKIFSEQQKNGTVDAHLYLLYAIFGGDATILLEQPDPLHTIFHIVTNTTTLNTWITRAGDNMVTRAGDLLVFRSVLQDLTNEEIAALLESTANYGEYIQFDIATNVDRNDYGQVTEFPMFYEDFGSVTQNAEIYADYGSVAESA